LLYNAFALNLAGWQSGYAAACKAVNAGSIPASASIIFEDFLLFKSIMKNI
jgi:hypothetical protein